MAKRVGKYKITKRESAMTLADGGAVDGNLFVAGTATVTGDFFSPTSLPSFTGLTVTGSTTVAAMTSTADTIHTFNYAGDAAQVVTLPAATAGTRVVYVLTVDTTGGTATLTFDCAGSDKYTTGQVIESRNSNAVVYDTSTVGETALVFTPANNANNYISQGSKFLFWCSTTGEWNVHLDAKDNPAGTGLLGATAFGS
tara:strand:+ start:442 stop:1035 length:594 start_codon:yes stop_codon:yes gene_type:complete